MREEEEGRKRGKEKGGGRDGGEGKRRTREEQEGQIASVKPWLNIMF